MRPFAASLFIWTAARHIRENGLPSQYTTVLKASDGSSLGISAGPLAFPADAVLLERLLPIVTHLEDRRFLVHRGVDWIGVARAFVVNLRSLSVRQGASTLTQQLVRNAYVFPSRSVLRKGVEIALALIIERWFSKQQIFKSYCETVYLGPGVRGFSAAVMSYFRRSPNTVKEGTLRSIAGCLREPMGASPLIRPDRFERRARQIQTFFPDSKESDLVKAPIRPAELARARLSSLALSEVVHRGLIGPGLKTITTTLDPVVQSELDRALRLSFRDSDVAAAAGVVIDRSSGVMLAEASLAHERPTSFSPAVAGRIQPGSTFKTFAFLEALEQGISADESFLSAPFEWRDERFAKGVWHVRNFRDSYRGACSLGEAFICSDNTVFARLVQKIGCDRLGARLRSFGLLATSRDHPAHVLGSIAGGVTLAQLCRSYAGLSSGILPPAPTIVQSGTYFDGSTFAVSEVPGQRLDVATLSVLDTWLRRAGIQLGDKAIPGKSGTVGPSSVFVAYDDRASYAVWIGFRRRRSEWWGKGMQAKTILERMLDGLAGRAFL